VLGLVLYTTGYYAFAALYVCAFVRSSTAALPTLVAACAYALGSVSFAVGSVCFAIDAVQRRCVGPRTNPVLWGSVAFLIGSLAFSADASLQFIHAAVRPANIVSDTAVLFGYGERAPLPSSALPDLT
jgi:hypothetical protein